MAFFSTLLAKIRSLIKSNDNQEITGDILQGLLVEITETVGAAGQFMGIARLQTGGNGKPIKPATVPVTDRPAVYLPTMTGTYTHFDGLTLADNEVALFYSIQGVDGNPIWYKAARTVAVSGGEVSEPQDVDIIRQRAAAGWAAGGGYMWANHSIYDEVPSTGNSTGETEMKSFNIIAGITDDIDYFDKVPIRNFCSLHISNSDLGDTFYLWLQLDDTMEYGLLLDRNYKGFRYSIAFHNLCGHDLKLSLKDPAGNYATGYIPEGWSVVDVFCDFQRDMVSATTRGYAEPLPGTGGASITVDTALSSTSTNPVQNKVVKAALDTKATGAKVNSLMILATSNQAQLNNMETFDAEGYGVTNMELLLDGAAILRNAAPGSGAKARNVLVYDNLVQSIFVDGLKSTVMPTQNMYNEAVLYLYNDGSDIKLRVRGINQDLIVGAIRRREYGSGSPVMVRVVVGVGYSYAQDRLFVFFTCSDGFYVEYVDRNIQPMSLDESVELSKGTLEIDRSVLDNVIAMDDGTEIVKKNP